MLCTAGTALAGAPVFQDVTTAAGIDALLSQDKPAGGIGVADFDRNGQPDVLLTGYFEANRLYFNNGDGTFSEDPDIAAQIALPGARCTGVATADFDSDGWPDAYLVCNGDNLLLRNVAGTGFENVITGPLNHPERSEAAAWADLTGNGLLDLVIGAHPRSSPPDPTDPDNYDRVLLQSADGQFTNIAPSLDISVPLGTTLAVQVADLDLDGRADIYIANDRHDGNVLLRNAGPGCDGWCFQDISVATGADHAAYSMGIAIGDYDLDGDWDLFYTSIFEQVLLQHQGATPDDLQYADVHADAGIDVPYIAWGTAFLDADNDGLEDLFVAVSGPSGHNWDRLFHNQGNGTFTDLQEASGLHQAIPTEAAARLDFDRDGRMDLLLSHSNMEYRLYRNVTPAAGEWIGFDLEGGGAVHRDAIGTRVELVTADGGRQMRELDAGASRGATHDPVLHFGLGAHAAAEVTIHWPDGLVESVGMLPAGHYHHRVHPAVEVLFRDRFAALSR